jgi:hypothetical protein
MGQPVWLFYGSIARCRDGGWNVAADVEKHLRSPRSADADRAALREAFDVKRPAP